MCAVVDAHAQPVDELAAEPSGYEQKDDRRNLEADREA
jgi:hypothetical protein